MFLICGNREWTMSDVLDLLNCQVCYVRPLFFSISEYFCEIVENLTVVFKKSMIDAT